MKNTLVILSQITEGTSKLFKYILCGTLGAFLLALIIIIAVCLSSKNKKIKRNSLENTRFYILHFKDNKVIFFDQTSLRNVKEMSLDKFYEQFTKNSLVVLKDWLNKLLSKDSKDIKSFLEANIHLSHNKSTSFVLLEATSINYEEQIIHIDSHLLPRLSPSGNKHSGRKYIISYEGFSAKYTQLIKSSTKHGVAILIKIYLKQNAIAQKGKNSMSALTLQCVNVLSPYLSTSRFITFTGVNEFLVLDTVVNNRSQFYSLANELVRKLNAFLVVSSLTDEYGVAVGASLINHEVKETKSLIAQCRETALFSERNEGSAISLYEEDKALAISGVNKYNEISSIIHNKSLRFYYTPIVVSSDASVYGYFVNILPYGSDMTIEEVINNAIDNNLLFSIEQTVFNEITRNIHKNESVFIQFTIPMISSLLNEKLDFNASNFTLCLDQESLYILDDLLISDIEDILNKAKDLGFKLGLQFSEVPTSALENDILSIFDCFIFKDELTNGLKNDNRIQADLRLMLASYQQFNVPIIVLGLASQSDLEIALNSNVLYFTSDAVALPSSTFENVDEKKAEKVISLYDQFN